MLTQDFFSPVKYPTLQLRHASESVCSWSQGLTAHGQPLLNVHASDVLHIEPTEINVSLRKEQRISYIRNQRGKWLGDILYVTFILALPIM